MNRRAALLVIDLQTAVFEDPAMPPVFEAATLVENARALVDAARSSGVPVIYICEPLHAWWPSFVVRRLDQPDR